MSSTHDSTRAYRPHTSTAFERIITRLIELGYTVRLYGSYATAQCPAHDDQRKPSLSILNQPGKKRARVRCFIEPPCEHAAIMAALGWTIGDLHDEPRAPRSAFPSFQVSAPAPKPKTAAEREPACLARHPEHLYAQAGFDPYRPEPGHIWYPWHTETGERAWRVRVPCQRVGCDRREFRWRKTDGRRTTFGMASDLLPYRYPELDAALRNGWQGPVLITEGESDCDAARAHGAQAVTAGSAGDWKPQHTWRLTYLGILQVVIAADRDLPGLRSAQKIKNQLERVGIRCHIVQARAGKDIRDHLAAGYRLDQLEAAA
jgi:putative DNA primase/helicase